MEEPIIDQTYCILYENEDFLAINKSGNCPVHEGGLYHKNCLTSILERDLSYRVFPVYRIDRETSGIVVFAKTSSKVKQIFDSISYKEYIAICEGELTNSQLIDKPIGECKGEHIKWKKCISVVGKQAKTFIEPVIYNDTKNVTIIKAVPMTGRQHQIRVHLSSIGHPIIGDKVYGKSDSLFKDYIDGKIINGRQLLHLSKVVIGNIEIESDSPKDIASFIY